jgi:hypothetical protein
MNKQLETIIAQVAAKVDPKFKSSFDKIIIAGQKVMYSPQTQKMVKSQLQADKDPAVVAGDGIAKLYMILMHESQNTINVKAAIPASTVLLCDALDFMESIGMVKITPDLIAKSTKVCTAGVMKVLGITPEMIAQAKQSQGAPATPAPQGILAGGQ